MREGLGRALARHGAADVVVNVFAVEDLVQEVGVFNRQSYEVQGCRYRDPRFTLAGHAGPVNEVAFSPDNRLIATASDDRTAVLWDADTGQCRVLLAGFAREVERLAFSPDAARLATTSLDGDVNIWETATGRNLQSFHPGRAVESPVAIGVAFSPDGSRLATVTPDGQIEDGTSRRIRLTFRGAGWQATQAHLRIARIQSGRHTYRNND